MKKSGVSLIVVAITIVFLSGCSVFMAAKQPDKKNLDLLKAGTPRNLVLAEFGQPVSTEVKEGKKCDIFSFTQG